jgi:salicylate hydroxylase
MPTERGIYKPTKPNQRNARAEYTKIVKNRAPWLTGTKFLQVGAGIQIPPNSSRILHSWGVGEALERRSVRPSGIVWRRWQDGKPIANARLGSHIVDKYGAPYYVTHRAHLHDALHERTQQLGVPVELSQRVQSYDLEKATVTFADGKVVMADLVIAADGMLQQ